MSTTDRIEKQILLRAPKARVWRALTDSAEFSAWFRVNLEGPFVVGGTVSGRITYPGHEHRTMEVRVERMEPEQLFSFRWHPYEPEPGVDLASALTTLVEFRLEDAPEGTRLTVTESGFDQLPVELRGTSFRSNSEGWAIQVENIKRHVGG